MRGFLAEAEGFVVTDVLVEVFEEDVVFGVVVEAFAEGFDVRAVFVELFAEVVDLEFEVFVLECEAFVFPDELFWHPDPGRELGVRVGVVVFGDDADFAVGFDERVDVLAEQRRE